MTNDLTLSFTVDKPAAEAFAAVLDVPSWWGRIDGTTDRPGSQWTYEVPGIHRTVQETTELVADRRVVWTVIDSFLSFVTDKNEWTGTRLVFDIAEHDGTTQVTFTQEGLVPSHECYDVCANAWAEYITGSLRARIVDGVGRPNSFEGDEAIDAV